MDDMRELVSIEAVERLFVVLAIAGPIIGGLAGAVLGLRTRSVARSALRGFAVGMAGVANWLLWRMYNALTDHYGLDSVKNLLVNLVIFTGLGLAAGVAYGYMMRRRDDQGAEGQTQEASAGGLRGKEDTDR
ncbi:MAG: hypothetical protein GX446_03920 [Chthonomonadales bacterium]|nr:hypothetical protein [Chthonomonadales bacterium]